MTFCEVSIFTIYSKHEFKTLMKVNFNKELKVKALISTDIRATEHINFCKICTQNSAQSDFFLLVSTCILIKTEKKY
jgi:hypothetical protein